MLLSVPTTVNLPSLNSMSSTFASSSAPAIDFPLAMMPSAAMRSATPPTIELRAEPLRHELREGGGMALAVRVGAGHDRHHARRIKAQLHPVVEDAGELDI